VRPFRSLGKDLIAYGIMGGVTRSLNLLLLPILTRLFSPDDYGIIDIIATLTSLLSLFMTLNLPSALARLWFESTKENRQEQLVSSVISFVVLAGSGIFVVIWYQSRWIAGILLDNPLLSAYIVLGALAALLTALCSIAEVILRMERKIARYNILNIVETVSYVALALLLVLRLETGLSGVFVARVIAVGLKLALGFFWVSGHAKFLFSFSDLKSAVSYSLPMFPAVVVTWINNQADRLLLLVFLGLGAVGVFSAAAKIVLIVGLLVSIFRQAWDPLAMELIDSDEARRNEFYRRVLNYYAGAMAAIALVFVAFSREILALVTSTEYQSGYVIIPWLIGAQIFHGSSSITNLGMLVSKRTFGNSIAAWTGAVVNIGLGVLLIPVFEIWGAAIGSFLAELIFTGMLWRFSARAASIQFDTWTIFWILIGYLITSSTVIAVYEFVENPVQSFVFRFLLLCLIISCIVRLILRSNPAAHFAYMQGNTLGPKVK
jgi:O-antigen/teichoic acid export membrane protein